ncbi:DNA polymerase IV [Mitsuokella sp. AF21-1AC]|uniref:DNA polymerase IV n=1 Tax=Mitsuokella sp. AF21-1AC TaxID=2292235 RepID=UPI000E52781A|nr:DNA polymerase IV [Mitsuokella sp. AF21-1AC]RGS70996.1 DNA polymerase IV [Mitsuokella sp. AF21-1AC]
MGRLVMHVDMDAFFASIEQRDHEEYRGQPVIVGGLSGRGVVSTCSYEARRFGVHSAMPMVRARRLCPQGIFLPGSYAHYRAVSQQIFAIFARYAPVVEPLSIDEAFLDLTGMEHLMGTPLAYAQKLKAEICARTGLVASVGIAPNKFLAKLASDLRKPDGLVIVTPENRQAILDPLPVGRIWGVGRKTEQALQGLGIRCIRDLRLTPHAKLAASLGGHMASHLLTLAVGQDDRPVAPREPAKSIGKEVTFPVDLQSPEEAEQVLLELAEKVGYRLRREGVKGRTVQLKLRLGNFKTYTRSRTLPEATCYDEEIYHVVQELFRTLGVKRGIRLLGVSVSGFDNDVELSLFAEQAQKKDRLYEAIDAIKARFGEHGITKAQLLRKNK